MHTLVNYFRQAGCPTRTVRWDARAPLAAEPGPGGLVVLSPGPGQPAEYDMAEALGEAVAAGLPVFGVGLGLQGIVEFCGGTLDHLPAPVHGRVSTIEVVAPGSTLFDRLPATFPAARYHSLAARANTLPSCLRVTARTADGLVMAVEHRELPVAAVQFHPESLLTTRQAIGLRLVRNAVTGLGVADPGVGAAGPTDRRSPGGTGWPPAACPGRVGTRPGHRGAAPGAPARPFSGGRVGVARGAWSSSSRADRPTR